MTEQASSLRRLDIRLLWILSLLLVALRVITLLFWGDNYLWPDEVYQTLEQAHRAVFGYGIVPWEFRGAVRSWVFPGALAGLMAMGIPFGREGYLMVPRLALSLLSVAPALVAFLWARRTAGRLAGVVAGLSVGVWFEIVYFAPKALAEVAASHVMIAGLYLLIEHGGERARVRAYWAGGLLCLAAMLRLQLSVGIVAAFLTQVALNWKSRRESVLRLRSMSVGALPVLVLFGLVDAIAWQYPFQSFWKYFAVNILSGKASEYGVLPFGAFLKYFIDVWSVAVIPIGLLAVHGARGRLPMAVAVVATFVLHSSVAHKEYRFDYPVAVMVLVLATLGTADLVKRQRLSRFSESAKVVVPWVAFACWAEASVMLGIRFDMAHIQMPLEIDQEGRPWTVRKGAMAGMRELGRDPDTCGVGIVNVGWQWVGGYTFLHRNVPLYEIWRWEEFAEASPRFNVFIGRGVERDVSPYREEQCWGEYCVYRRSGRCQPPEVGYSINGVLISRGQ